MAVCLAVPATKENKRVAAMMLKKLLADYLLRHELKLSSQRQMRIIVQVFLNWAQVDDMPVSEFTADRIREFLAHRQLAGRSSYYRRSLRNTLKAIYRFGRGSLPAEPIRPVRLETLEPDSWTPAEVGKLVAACDDLSYRDRTYWRTFLLSAFYTGLNACDLHRLEKRHILSNGAIPFTRAKTGKRVFVAIPPDLVQEIYAFAPEAGPIWPERTSQEWFRRRFARLVRIANIPPGPFKRLRKTSGTLVEFATPGQGHRHLGNEPQIFAKHYEDRKVTQAHPTMPAVLKLG
jgi:integrase